MHSKATSDSQPAATQQRRAAIRNGESYTAPAQDSDGSVVLTKFVANPFSRKG